MADDLEVILVVVLAWLMLNVGLVMLLTRSERRRRRASGNGWGEGQQGGPLVHALFDPRLARWQPERRQRPRHGGRPDRRQSGSGARPGWGVAQASQVTGRGLAT